MKKKYYHIILFVLGTALTSLIVACEGRDEDQQGTDDDTTYAVNFEVSTRAAVNTPVNDDAQAEKMKSLLLIIVKTDGKIEAVIDKKNLDNNDAKTSYQEIVELTAGPKTLYGFANLTDEMCTAAGLTNLIIGNAFPLTIADALCRTDQRSGNYIPMSNMQEITVTRLPGQKYIIELIRMMCKITFKVTNESGYAIELQQIVTNPVTTLESPLYLLPHTDSDGNCILPNETKTDSIQWAWPSAAKQTLENNDTSNDFTIYLNESKVANDGWFTFQLNTLKEGKTNYDRFNISNIQALNRNEHLPVNIILTDYKLRLDVLSYPPIGGYPSVEMPMQDKEYFAHFPGGGPFIITPKLSKYSTGEEVTEGVVWNMTVSGDTEIFDVQPTLDKKTGEVTGTLKYSASTTGNLKVLCTMTAQITMSGTNINRELTYKIYIQNY